ncbi:hypothetical protein KRMM14A1259_15980 [Krasilnikovia sp. MM14-A1259]
MGGKAFGKGSGKDGTRAFHRRKGGEIITGGRANGTAGSQWRADGDRARVSCLEAPGCRRLRLPGGRARAHDLAAGHPPRFAARMDGR